MYPSCIHLRPKFASIDWSVGRGHLGHLTPRQTCPPCFHLSPKILSIFIHPLIKKWMSTAPIWSLRALDTWPDISLLLPSQPSDFIQIKRKARSRTLENICPFWLLSWVEKLRKLSRRFCSTPAIILNGRDFKSNQMQPNPSLTPQRPICSLYSRQLWWPTRWQVLVNIRRVRPCPGHQSAGLASISKDPPLGTGTTQLYTRHQTNHCFLMVFAAFICINNKNS